MTNINVIIVSGSFIVAVTSSCFSAKFGSELRGVGTVLVLDSGPVFYL